MLNIEIKSSHGVLILQPPTLRGQNGRGHPPKKFNLFHDSQQIDRKSQQVSSTSDHWFSCDRHLNICWFNILPLPHKYDGIETETYEVKVLGDVNLSEEEKQVLKLHNKFVVLDNIKPDAMDKKIEASLAKMRMEKEKDKTYQDFTKEERKEDE